MGHRCVAVIDTELGEELVELSVVKLAAVVENDDPGKFEPAYNHLPDKILYLWFGNLGDGFGLDPLGEIIDGENEEFPLSRGQGKRSKDVDSLLGKRPRSIDRC